MKKCIYQGFTFDCWVCRPDLVGWAWKIGELKPGQVWAQLDVDGPYRPVTLI